MMRSIAVLAISMMLLTGCGTARVAGSCPPLAPPPNAALDALVEAGASDPSTAAWVVELSRHYDKLDACRGVT